LRSVKRKKKIFSRKGGGNQVQVVANPRDWRKCQGAVQKEGGGETGYRKDKQQQHRKGGKNEKKVGGPTANRKEKNWRSMRHNQRGNLRKGEERKNPQGRDAKQYGDTMPEKGKGSHNMMQSTRVGGEK